MKKARRKSGFLNAEEEGFEPPVPHGTTVFKTAAIDHSATPLGPFEQMFFSVRVCKSILFPHFWQGQNQIFLKFLALKALFEK
jgi:hypothetical protein